MNIKPCSTPCGFLLGCAVLVSGAQVWAQAQPRVEKEEARVEWDFSRRTPIHPSPFAKTPLAGTSPDASPGASAGGVQPALRHELQERDQTEKSWTVQFSDGTVRRMLQRWADDAGYQLLWEVPRDYPIEVEMQLHGTFRDAVRLVAKSLAVTDAPVQASINPEIRLIRVVRYLNSQAR